MKKAIGAAVLVLLTSVLDLCSCHASIPLEPISNYHAVSSLPSLIDLEASPQDFVLESKQIKIEQYPTAFNPTVVRWQGSLLMAFRIRDPVTLSTDEIGMVWLDEDFELNSPIYVLQVPSYPSILPSKQQDPRLLVIGERLHMVYSNILCGEVTLELRRVFLTEVHFDGSQFYADAPEGIFYFENQDERRAEKNWVPFDYQGELCLAYSLFPHSIVKPISGTNTCAPFTTSNRGTDWKWGVPRGGTQAYADGDKYLAFFHSSTYFPTVQSNGIKFQHYFIGAYTFSLTPPFEITHISPEPIVGKGFYSGPPYKTWKPLRVVFPGGFIFDEAFLWLFYGKQDHEIWVTKLDKQKLLESLSPVGEKNK